MFEYHGWITLLPTAEVVDPEPPLRLAEIEAAAVELDGVGLLDLRVVNGMHQLHLGGFRNHRAPAVLDLFAEVGRLAPGSYGVLYVHDDEDPEHASRFRVLRLVRGVVTEHEDHLLSPTIPTLEDPWVG